MKFYGKPFKAREIKILHLIAEGKSNTEIGEIMSFSVNTIKVYVSFILGRLNVETRVEAVMKALKLGLIEYTFEG